MTIEFGIAANNKRFVEAEAGTVNIGDVFKKEMKVEAFEPTKKELRIGKKATPAGTLVRTYTVTAAGKEFAKTQQDGSVKYMQRFYCETTEQII
nr:hypothetical protein [uncultured Halomonas sp.]